MENEFDFDTTGWRVPPELQARVDEHIAQLAALPVKLQILTVMKAAALVEGILDQASHQGTHPDRVALAKAYLRLAHQRIYKAVGARLHQDPGAAGDWVLGAVRNLFQAEDHVS